MYVERLVGVADVKANGPSRGSRVHGVGEDGFQRGRHRVVSPEDGENAGGIEGIVTRMGILGKARLLKRSGYGLRVCSQGKSKSTVRFLKVECTGV